MQHRPSSPFLIAGLAAVFTLAAEGQQQDQLALKSRQAKTLLTQGRFADAIPLYEELVKALPGNPGLRLNLGTAEHMAGRDREAAATLGALLRADPNNGPALAMCGASYCLVALVLVLLYVESCAESPRNFSSATKR